VPSLLNGLLNSKVAAFAWYSVKIHVIFGVRLLRRKFDKKQTYIKTETLKLYSGVLWIFLPNFVKIDPCNFELYRFKVGAFFETHALYSLGLKVALYMSTKSVNLLEQSKHRQQTSGRLKRTPQRYKILREHLRTLTLRLPALSAYSTLLPRSRWVLFIVVAGIPWSRECVDMGHRRSRRRRCVECARTGNGSPAWPTTHGS